MTPMFTCPHCTFETASHQGLAVHVTRMHGKHAIEIKNRGTDPGYAVPDEMADSVLHPSRMPGVRPRIKKAWCGHVVGESQGVAFTESDRGFTVELCPECASKIE